MHSIVMHFPGGGRKRNPLAGSQIPGVGRADTSQHSLQYRSPGSSNTSQVDYTGQWNVVNEDTHENQSATKVEIGSHTNLERSLPGHNRFDQIYFSIFLIFTLPS